MKYKSGIAAIFLTIVSDGKAWPNLNVQAQKSPVQLVPDPQSSERKVTQRIPGEEEERREEELEKPQSQRNEGLWKKQQSKKRVLVDKSRKKRLREVSGL